MWYGYATFIGAVSGGMVNCAINYRWVFHAFGMKKKYIALRYMFVWGVSIALNTLGTCQVTEMTGLNYVIPKAIVAVLVGRPSIISNSPAKRMTPPLHPIQA